MPIGAASGMTVAQPASSSFFARTGSGSMYGSTVNPSATSVSAAFSVSTGSGSEIARVGDDLELDPVRQASCAGELRPCARPLRPSRSPDVFGSSRMSSGRKEVMSSPGSSKSMRRTATVTISAPDAATAAAHELERLVLAGAQDEARAEAPPCDRQCVVHPSPSAGMTQIRFSGRGLVAASQSPAQGLPLRVRLAAQDGGRPRRRPPTRRCTGDP